MVNIVICDDEQAYQDILKFKIGQCMDKMFNMEYNIKCFDNLSMLKQHIEDDKVDIVFLDIMINEENSMDWSITNIKNKYTQIIFMTSFPQSVYNISEANCCYFLMKSKLNTENLTKALQRALQNNTKKDPNMTLVKSGSKNYIVNSQDIKFIETFNNNITLHLLSGEDIKIYSTLKEYSEKLPPNFLRCHKCYMINMNHISSYEPHKFTLSTGEAIPIPPKKYKEIVKIYLDYLTNI